MSIRDALLFFSTVITSYSIHYTKLYEAAIIHGECHVAFPEEEVSAPRRGVERHPAERAGLLVRNERGGVYDRFRDRVLFPIYDISGRVCGFGGRIIGEGQPKYLNSPESRIYAKSKLLLGLYQSKSYNFV